MKKWGIYIAVALAFAVYTATTKVDRDSTGAIVGGGSIDAFEIKVGDCFDDSSSDDDEFSELPGVPCSEPHDNEVFSVLDVTIKTYPEGEGMWELANESCMEGFDSFVGKDYESSSLDIFAMYPSIESWKQDDREVVCAVYDMDEGKLVGSVQGRAL